MDKWEMLPGDDVIDKVFEEGIKNSQVVIVVLSPHSVNKEFPKAERDVAVIKKINGEIRVIPILLDIKKEKVPESLKSTFWIRIEDLNDYASELDEITNTILGHSDKPPLGKLPKYTQIASIEELEESDTLVLKLACEELMEIGYRAELLSPSGIVAKAESFGMSENDVLESLDVLDRLGYIETGGVGGIYIEVTEMGFDVFCRTYVKNYASIQRAVGLEIENKGKDHNKSIAESLKRPQIVVDHILHVFESKGWLRLYSTIGGDIEIYDKSTLFRGRGKN